MQPDALFDPPTTAAQHDLDHAVGPDPDPAPVDCDDLHRRTPDLHAWLARAVRWQLDAGEQWRSADPQHLAEQIARRITAGILPVLDQWSVERSHQEFHRMGLRLRCTSAGTEASTEDE